MWTYPKVFPCPLAFIPLRRSGRPCNLCRGEEDRVKRYWRWWAEALHVVSLSRNTVSQCSESQEIKICTFPGEWLWIRHALYWQLLVYLFPFFIQSSMYHVPVMVSLPCKIQYSMFPLLCWNNLWSKYVNQWFISLYWPRVSHELEMCAWSE